ncbi:MAG: DUF2834 domain-containing protein [Rhizomicrobium sp.]|jgi:hypothetical protein
MSTSRKVLCAFYALVALAAFWGTWSENVAYFASPGRAGAMFLFDLKANPGTRSISIDLTLFLLAAATWMILEARRIGVRFVAAYIVGAFAIAISVTFPLFLIARELRLAKVNGQGKRDTPPTATDAVGIVLLIAISAALVWYLHAR